MSKGKTKKISSNRFFAILIDLKGTMICFPCVIIHLKCLEGQLLFQLIIYPIVTNKSFVFQSILRGKESIMMGIERVGKNVTSSKKSAHMREREKNLILVRRRFGYIVWKWLGISLFFVLVSNHSLMVFLEFFSVSFFWCFSPRFFFSFLFFSPIGERRRSKKKETIFSFAFLHLSAIVIFLRRMKDLSE